MKREQLHTLYVVLFPVLLAAGILTIPVVSDYSNHILAEQAANQTVRWFWGHLMSAAAFGVSILAAYSINLHLSAKGERRFGTISLPFITVGATFYVFGLGADGIGPLATDAGGGRALMFFEGSAIWVSSVFITASIIFGLGLITQVMGVIRASLLIGIIRVVVFVAAIVFIAATAIPSGWGLWVVASAAAVVYFPIGMALWHNSIGR